MAEAETEHVNSMHRHRVTEMFDIVVDDNQRRNWEALRCQGHAVAVAVVAAVAAASHTAQRRSTPFPSHYPTCSCHPNHPYHQTRASQQHPYRSYRNTNTSRHVHHTH